MAKSMKRKKSSSKPYIAAAFFCETVIEDKKDGSLSVVRIVDTISFVFDASTPPDFPSEALRLAVPISGLISFRTIDAPGEHTVRLVMESPSGKLDSETPFEQKFAFTDTPQGGINITIKSILQVMKGGLFKLHVFLDDEEITQVPLFISIQRTDTLPVIQPPDDGISKINVLGDQRSLVPSPRAQLPSKKLNKSDKR